MNEKGEGAGYRPKGPVDRTGFIFCGSWCKMKI